MFRSKNFRSAGASAGTLLAIPFAALLMAFAAAPGQLQTAALATDSLGTSYKFFVGFQDRKPGRYSLSRPAEFLSARAIERRRAQGIAITEDDFPVDADYLGKVQAAGVRLLYATRWFNGAVIETADSLLGENLRKQAFVNEVEFLGSWKKQPVARSRGDREPYGIDVFNAYKDAQDKSTGWLRNLASRGYGNALGQIDQINGIRLHDLGFQGQGKMIAVLDAGFQMVNYLAAFDSIRLQGRILAQRDFVDFDGNVYNDDDHGTSVLSCLAADAPGSALGTAPRASYLLLRTEDANSEFPVEEFNWARGAEFADSMGADIINSSLGYTRFDWLERFGHDLSELDGKTTRITRAAEMAAARGILVVSSAGNEGGSDWGRIGAPADGPNVLSVGAVDRLGRSVYFSSTGPTADGRIKPDVCALGEDVWVAGTSGYFSPVNGTSFSAPLLAGMAACLWQALPHLDAAGIRKLIKSTAQRNEFADSLYGAGIPDFYGAFCLSGRNPWFNAAFPQLMSRIPERLTTPEMFIRFYSNTEGTYSFQLLMERGRVADLQTAAFGKGEHRNIRLRGMSQPGKYTLRVTGPGFASNYPIFRSDFSDLYQY
jgi:subtilisin family serine protease